MATPMQKRLIWINWLPKESVIPTPSCRDQFARPLVQAFPRPCIQRLLARYTTAVSQSDLSSCIFYPHYLMKAGYISTQINTDLNTYIDSDEWSKYLNIEDLWKDRTDDKPFFAICSFSESHASTFKMNPEEVRLQRSNLLQDKELHDPDKAPIPSFVPQHPPRP